MRQPPAASHTPARIEPAQRAAREPTGTLHRHAACSPASCLPPPPAPFSVSASRESVSRTPTRTMRHNPCLRASRPAEGLARCALTLRTTLILRLPAPCHVAAQGLPVSARLRGSAPQDRAGRLPAGLCRRRNPAPSLRSPWPPPLRTQLPRRASRRAALRASARDIRRPAARAFSGWAVVSRARVPACVLGAPRAVAASPPRFARTAPRPASANASASLTPPREPPAPFAFPSRAAALRFCHHPATPAALPFPRRQPRASGVEWLAVLAPMTSKGTRRRALASSLAREELHCALRLPAARE